MKTFLKVLLIALIAAVLLFAGARYGWRLLGFSACDEIGQNYIESVNADADNVFITGGVGDSFSAYVGSIYEISDGKLYLGLKHNAFLGFFERVGGFCVCVPTNGQTISEVYLKDGNSERLIWTQADGIAESQPVNPSPEQEAAPAEAGDTPLDENIVQASYPFDGADAENDLCAVVFLGYDEATANETVARLCGQYEVLHELFRQGDVVPFDANGAEQYLIIPKYAGTVVTISKVLLADDGTLQPDGDALTTESLLRVYANYSDIVPSALITVQYGAQSITFSPFISLENGNIAKIDGAFTQMG